MRSSSFLVSLLVFILLMCSCRSKKVVSDVSSDVKYVSEVSYIGESSKIDTTKTIRTEQMKEHTIVKETITETEYDTDKNVVKKVTTTERTIAQGVETDIAEEVQNRVETHSKDSLNHVADVSQEVEIKVKEEVTGGQESFGKWFGMGLACVIGVFVLYLLRKLRIK